MQNLEFFVAWNSFLANQGHLLRIDSAADLERVKASGRIGILLGIQNAEHFRTPNDVDTFYAAGQRVAQLTYNARNLIGNGSTERRDEGLSDFGLAIVERMNKKGMAVDTSHCGDRTTLDAFEATRRSGPDHALELPRAGARAPPLQDRRSHSQNGGDGGRDGDHRRPHVRARRGAHHHRAFRRSHRPRRETDVDRTRRHRERHRPVRLDAMKPEDNKRLRDSYKGTYGFREKIDIDGINHPQRMFDVAEALIRRKYSDRNIELVLGGNFARVLAEIWKREPSA